MLRVFSPSARAFSSAFINVTSLRQSFITSGLRSARAIASGRSSPCLINSKTLCFASRRAATLWCSSPTLATIYNTPIEINHIGVISPLIARAEKRARYPLAFVAGKKASPSRLDRLTSHYRSPILYITRSNKDSERYEL